MGPTGPLLGHMGPTGPLLGHMGPLLLKASHEMVREARPTRRLAQRSVRDCDLANQATLLWFET
jgi:hypothetical protein